MTKSEGMVYDGTSLKKKLKLCKRINRGFMTPTVHGPHKLLVTSLPGLILDPKMKGSSNALIRLWFLIKITLDFSVRKGDR